jgi:branched-chain amino acid transport system substrate-binding protein
MRVLQRVNLSYALLAAAALMAAVVLAVADNSSAASAHTTAKAASLSPITIGVSLSLSGDFSADGQAYQKGYELWASDQNKAGGLLGHPIKLDIISDASSTSQVVTNYEKLIGSNKDQLVFAPFSTLLTVPAARVAARYGYAMVGGSDGGPTVFSAGLKNVFDVSIPVKSNLVTFAQWVASLPKAKRPKTAAYVTVDDPFTQPQIPLAQKILKKAGVKTVVDKVFPEEATDYSAIANEVATAKPDVVILGSVDVPTVSAFTHVFIQQHYNPKAFIATSGPDQGQQFVNAVGSGNENGIFVPNGWYPGFKKADSEKMVKDYVAKYGGTASGVNADVAEAYSVGQVLTQAVKATGGFNQPKIIKYLKSNVTLNSVQGPVKFNRLGENLAQKTLTFQWQNGTLKQVIPTGTAGSVKPEYPKPAWK